MLNGVIINEAALLDLEGLYSAFLVSIGRQGRSNELIRFSINFTRMNIPSHEQNTIITMWFRIWL